MNSSPDEFGIAKILDHIKYVKQDYSKLNTYMQFIKKLILELDPSLSEVLQKY